MYLECALNEGDAGHGIAEGDGHILVLALHVRYCFPAHFLISGHREHDADAGHHTVLGLY